MTRIVYLMAAMVLLFAALPAHAVVTPGQQAPEIEATDVNGQPFKLSDQKGKIVVLEWTNSECPYVVKHYETGNMQKTQEAATGKGIVWVSINSAAAGRQGHVDAEGAKKIIAEKSSKATTYITDDSGAIGHAYGAQTTPHMFVIDAEGKIAYAGAIDSDPSPRHESVQTATNYVLAALGDLEAGNPVATPTSQPYGCAVKYGE